ncbi:MAG: hypothetical protein OEW75_05285, partial [Cyclobacteriaceae bacterium]|nr:hypothetical protein [Cyclobacteriaceae bacterium]
PKGEYGRIGLAISKNKPNIIYALVESAKNALYKTEDGGYKWTKINDGEDIGNRPFYYSDIFVDPTNENRVYSLFSLVNWSEDGGKSFNTLLPYSGIHPDHHAWWIHPENGNFMIDGNDGGLNITRDGGKTWRFVENLPVAQYYHINVDMEYPYNVYGGMQDNGTWVGPAYVLRNQGIRNSYWQEVMFGDGFDAMPDADDSRYGYAMSQQGNVGRFDRETGRVNFVKPTHPDADLRVRFNWNAAIAQDPFDNSTIYFGSQFVHKSIDKGKTWEVISSDLTTNDPNKQKQDESGGLTIDATGAENYCTILAIEPSTLEKGVIWAGTDDGKLHLTRDGGKSWTDLTNSVGLPRGAWIPQIRASKFNAGEAYLIVNNYRLFDFKPYLFRTRDYGKTWQNIVSENKVSGYTLSVIQDPVEKKLIFLGTENGLFISIDEGANWTKWTISYPTVSTMDLAIHPREQDLVVGTFGRAAYVLDDIRPLREIAASGGAIQNKKLHVFTPPTAILAETQQPEGARFPGDAFYQGENRSTGAMISYMLNKNTSSTSTVASVAPAKGKKSKGTAANTVSDTVEKKPKSNKTDSVFVMIYDKSGKKTRTLKYKEPEKEGLQRIYWNLDEDGISRPSRRAGGNNRFQPGGVTVLPGEYTVKIKHGEDSASTLIKVENDPRLDMPYEELEAKYKLQKEIESHISILAEAAKRINESLALITDFEKKLKEKKGDEFKDIKEETKQLKDSLNLFLDNIVGPQSEKQGLTRSLTPTVSSYFFMANRYVSSVDGMPGATEERLLNQGKVKLDAIIESIDKFYDTNWKIWRSHIEALDLSPFKEYTPLKK